jgi:diguanylate cyclase (GGDEF)-like protein
MTSAPLLGSPAITAHLDSLTGLPDRGDCIRAIANLVEAGQDSDHRLSVLWLDIDRFKQVNDSFGHLVGDSVLAELARRMSRAMARRGFLARMGGDEFAIVLPDLDQAGADRIGKELLAAIGRPLGVGTVRLRPTASIGIAQWRDDEEPHELLERADRAMNEAKRRGGGQILDAGPAAQHGHHGKHLAREVLAVEEALHRAMENGGLYLDYQPIIRVDNGLPEAAEALMRCRVEGGSLPPGRFIPVAEKTGLIVHLGEWSLITASSLANRLHVQGLTTKVAVNVSRAQLIAPKFTQALHAVLAASNVPAELIELEITESLFMDSSEVVQRNLHAALEAGFPLALDDFGTGYSSLGCLKDLPASKLKLDRAFVIDLPHNRRSFAVVKAVTQLALDLGMTVVAEGIETEEQYHTLCDAGVTAIQGFYLARPMGEADFLAWLSRRRAP